MKKLAKHLILIIICLFVFTSCTTANTSQSKNSEETLLGVWVYSTTYSESDAYQEFKFTFSEFNGNFIGTYLETYHSERQKYRVSFKKFKYKVKKDRLILIFDDGNEYQENFTVANNILTYQNIDYSLSKQETYFNNSPSDSEYRELLNGEEFFDVQTQTYASIISLPYKNDNYLGYAVRYAYADLDDNGIDELLIEYSLNGDTAILRWDLGEWEAFYVPFRGIIELKVDGTASGSGGYDNGSIHRFSFNSTVGEAEYKDIITYDYNNGLFTLNGFACDENTVQSILDEQFAKQDIVWLQLDKSIC